MTSSRNSKSAGTWVLAASILGSSMAFIDGTAVNVALPALQSALHATVSNVQWVIESYALLLASLLLVGGSLGDLFGRRKIFLIGVVLFALASAWCGLAGSIMTLIIARGVQGAGAALLVPGSLSLLTASFPEETRGRAIGTWSGFTTLTAAIGPVFGGWLVEHASWRWVFFLNLPIALAVLIITIWRVPESRHDGASTHVDWTGATLATIGLGAITYALIEAPKGATRAIVTAVIGVAALAGFLYVEANCPNPMVRLSLFRSRNFTGANLLTFLLYSALGGVLFFFPLDLIQIQHYTATQAGGALLPLIALMAALSRWSGGLVARYGAKLPLTVGPLIAAARPQLAAALDPDPRIQQAIAESFISGFRIILWLAAALAAAGRGGDGDDGVVAKGFGHRHSRMTRRVEVDKADRAACGVNGIRTKRGGSGRRGHKGSFSPFFRQHVVDRRGWGGFAARIPPCPTFFRPCTNPRASIPHQAN